MKEITCIACGEPINSKLVLRIALNTQGDMLPFHETCWELRREIEYPDFGLLNGIAGFYRYGVSFFGGLILALITWWIYFTVTIPVDEGFVSTFNRSPILSIIFLALGPVFMIPGLIGYIRKRKEAWRLYKRHVAE